MSSTNHLSELESLRSQVADRARELAEREQSMRAQRHHFEETMQDLRERSRLLHAIIEGTAAETGDEFFASLVTHLTSTLPVQYAVIGEVCEGRHMKIRTLAVAAGGTLVDNFEYELAHTPCATALTQTFACFDRDVQAMFPQFQRLADLGAESYCGVPLRTKDGTVMGLLAVMDTKPLQHSADLQSLLGVFAPRVVVEFERRRVEQERAQVLADLYNVIETVPDIMFTLDTQGNLVKWNRRLGDVTGYSPEELLNKPALTFVPLEEQTRTAAAIQRAFTEGYAELEGQLLTRDLRTIPYHWSGALLKNSHGEPIGITGIGRDVSDKKRVEEALGESEERFALAVMGSTDILWDAHRLRGKPWYAPETPIWWSPGVQELLGLEESEPFETLDQWAVRLHPGDKERVFSQLAAHIDHRVPYDAEYRLRTNRGDYRWIRGRGQASWDEQGEIRRMSGSCQDITDRKRAEEAIREAELRYRTIFEQAGAGVAQIESHTGRFVQVNRRYCEIVGLTEAEMLATTFGVITHPDDLQSDLENMTRLLRGEIRSFTMEKRYVRPDGGIVWVNLNVAPLWRPGEQVTHHIAIVEDITDRKRADEALRKSEERYARATAVGKVGVWELDVPTGMYHGDTNLKALFGYVDDELSTDPSVWLSLVHPDDQAIALDHWQRIVNGESDNCNYELRMLKKDGTVIWTEVRGHAVRNHEGQVTHLFGATVDISERKQAQDALAQSERQLRTVLDALPVGVWFTDQTGKPVLANPAAKQIWSGIRQVGIEAAANAAGWWEAIRPSSELHRWALSHALTTGVPSLHESLDLECLDGTKKTIRNLAVPVRDEAGVVLGAIVVNEDITALRQAQETLRLTQFSVDHAVEGFFWISPDAKILRVNDAACRMLEYSRDELMAMTVPDIDPTLPPEVWPAHWRELKQKGSLTFESKHWSKTGHVLDTEVTFKYLQYEGKEYNCAIMRDIGERKRADAALRESETRFRAIFDQTFQFIGLMKTDGTLIEANRSSLQFAGIREQDVLGKLFWDTPWWTHSPDLQDRLREAVRQAAGGAMVRFEATHPHPTGELAYVDFSLKPVRDEHGNVILLIPEGRDITERKRAEESLQLAKFSMDRAADAVYWIDSQAKVLDTNEAASLMLGYSKEELCAMTVHDLNPDFQTDMWSGYWAETQRRGTMVIETAHRAKNGRLIPVEVSVNHLAYEGKEYHCAFVRDITERMQAETTLRQSEERYRSLVDNAPIGIFVNEEGRFVYVNREMQRILKATSAEQLIGMKVLDRIAPEFHQVVTDRIRTLLDKQQPVPSLDEQYVRLDGSRVDVAVTAIPTSFGDTPMMQVLVLDIAERKRMEDALRQREGDLRAAIEERERISRDLHDGILQSLFAVGLTLETTKSMMSSRTRKKSGLPLNQAIDQLNRVMHEIRNFIAGLGSDLLQGKDLQTALQHMLDSLTQNQATHVRLAVEDRVAQAVSVEQSLHLLLVIQEAVSNCIRHGRAQEATVSLKMLKQGIRLSVRDNGRGFNPEAATGTGHGLANMAVRARKIGGRFTVMSKVNEGTRIVLDLPKETSDVLR